MNFTYKVRKPLDGQFGSLSENNTWTGMINELNQKRADIGFAMGLTGTQIAKDAADIILLDERFKV